MEDKKNQESKKLTAVERQKMTKIANASAITFSFAFVIALFCISFPNKYLVPFIISAIIAVATFVSCITLNVLAGKPGKYLKEKRAQYARLTAVKDIDFKGELETVRSNYAADDYAYKNRIEKVRGIGTNTLYDYSVLSKGKIVYGYIVEANSDIFKYKEGMRVYPAVAVFGMDEYFETHPYALAKTAEELYANRNFNILANERNFFTSKKIADGDGRELYVTTLLLYRPYLPVYTLQGALLPVIVDPTGCPSVFTVDSDYWTDALISNFICGDGARKEEEALKELN